MRALKFLGTLSLATLLPLGTVFADDPEMEKPATEKPVEKPADEAKPNKRNKRAAKYLDRIRQRFETVLDGVGATAEQRAQAREKIGALVRERMAEARKNGGPLDKKARREANKAMQKKLRNAMAEILTPEQREKMKELRKQMGKRGKQGKRGKRGKQGKKKAQSADQILESLSVSPEEAAVLKPSFETFLQTRQLIQQSRRERMGVLKKNLETAAGDEDKIAGLLKKFREERAEDKKQLQQVQSELVKTLTSEQEAKLVVDGVID